MPQSLDKKKACEDTSRLARLRERSVHIRKAVRKWLPSWIHGLTEPKWQRWGLIIGTSLFAAFLMAPKSMHVYSLAVGETAPETIISPITFKVVDEEATNKRRDEVLKSVRPVYDLDDEMVNDVNSRITQAFKFINQYLEEEADYRSRELDKSTERAKGDTSKRGDAAAFRPLDDSTLRTRYENLLGARVSPSNFALLKAMGFNARIEEDLRSLVVPVLLKGVVLSHDLVRRDGQHGILLRSKSKQKLEPLRDLNAIYDLKQAVNFINNLENEPSRDTSYSRAIRQIAMDLVNVNITYNREESDKLKQEAQKSIKDVYFEVGKGEPIIREGDPVNKGHQLKLAQLNKSNPMYSRYMILAGLTLLLVLLLQFCFHFSEKYLDRSASAIEDLLLFCLLLVGTIALARFTASLSPLLASVGEGMDSRSILYAAPVATAAMLAALMVDARIAFIFAALTAVTATLAVEGDVYLFSFYLVSGIVGLHGMTHITDRTSVLKAGTFVGLVNMLSILAIRMAIGELTTLENIYTIGIGFLGGVFSALLVSGLAPLLEPLGYTTNVRLLELANLNHPLLKEMALQAPGTYHHSMMVGNLVEAAAEKIGANPLLARVGALYHDIGKAGKKTKQYYFIENQERGGNPHDKLEPSMSALILVSHVKYGVEKAREHKLGAPIIDIIQQHHGTNLIKFFYTKALEKAEKNHQSVSEDKYRYSGPRPRSKEAALVMLADVCEAACRTLAEPTPARIQKRVQTLIMGLFSEGQLDESTLTLKDIHAITKSFVRSLQGILHSRIDYPADVRAQEKTNGDLSKQQSDKNRDRPFRIDSENIASIRRLGL
ncbi:MAG: HDIG domain-containing protein [Desulfomonilaceae bacterium]|nr:HDIG domain-containing protein [Desulfomonilaceae bacterium]